MGFPEIVAFARNFAVMVRIQGPDPKGLKMRKHGFHHYNSGKTTLSASGMLFRGFCQNDSRAKQIGSNENAESSQDFVLVLTVASVIEPFLSQQYRHDMSKGKHQLINGVQIDILVEGKKEVGIERTNDEASCCLPVELLEMINIPTSSTAVQYLIEASPGSVEHGWEVGWSLASYASAPQSITGATGSQLYVRTLPPTPQLQVPSGTSSSKASVLCLQVEKSSFQTQGQMMGLESSNPNSLGKSTTRIALLRVSSKISGDLPLLNTLPSRRGDLLFAMGSPFGILSPVHFLNSIAVGSIANSYPACSYDRSLLMADIRCLPGMEGSPVFGEQAQFIGILARPLRQRTSGAEIQLVIPWEAIASACSDLLQEEPQLRWKDIFYNSQNLNAVGKTSTKSLHVDRPVHCIHESLHSGSFLPSPVEKAISSICLITIDDGAWASGVLLNKQGLVLTNAHLLEPWRFGKAAAAGETNETKSQAISLPFSEHMFPGHQQFSGFLRGQNFLPIGGKNAGFSTGEEHEASRFNLIKSTGHRSIRVRLDVTDPWIWSDARVVYVSRGPLDVALLQLEFVPDKVVPISVDLTYPSPGSKAYVIGHGLFGPRCDSLPSACLGFISKVVEAKRELHHESSLHLDTQGQIPAMLETTAAVHPGGSGGAIVNLDGQMVALVTSNAKYGGGTVIPHLNFSIPCAALAPIFKFSEDMQTLSILEDLDRPNEHLSAIWALMPPLTPKPGPSLPTLPQFQLGDNEKDNKGSRFAKFMAERNDLLKKTLELGKDENLSSKFLRSKL